MEIVNYLDIGLITFGILGLTVFCCYGIFCENNNNDNDEIVNSNSDHVIVTIVELADIKSSVLRSIPVVDFNSKDFKDGVECVVCLSDLVDRDKARVLPSCNHCFHADCIDRWFRSHSNCPICRIEVEGTKPKLGDH